MSRLEILAIGHIPPPSHGQSISFLVSTDALKEDFTVKVVDISDKLKLFLVPFIILLYRPKIVYLSLVRTPKGALYDSLIVLISKLIRTKIVAHIHGNDLNILKEDLGVFWSVYNNLFKNTTIIMLHRFLSQIAPVNEWNITCLNNFATEYSLKINKNCKSFGYIGGLHYSKGVTICANILSFVDSLYFAGPCRDDLCFSKKYVELLINRLKKKKNFYYLGTLDHNNVVSFWEKIDILIFPTFYPTEAQPLIILDALLNGKWLILPNIPLLHKQFSTFKSISWVDDYSYQSWQNVVKNVFKDYDINLINDSVKIAQKYYGINNYKKNFKKIFKEKLILNKK